MKHSRVSRADSSLKKSSSDKKSLSSTPMGKLPVVVSKENSAANDSDNISDSSDELARVQEILFGNAANQIEKRLNELDLQWREAVDQLQKQFTTSLEALQKETRTTIVEQQREHEDSRLKILARINQTTGDLTEDYKQSKQQAAAALTKTRRSLEDRIKKNSTEVAQLTGTLQGAKVDRRELTTLLQQMADGLRIDDPNKKPDPKSQKI